MTILRAENLAKRLEFMREIDRLKSVYRQAWLADGSRNESDGEHCWHVSVLALLFSDLIEEKGLDLLKIVKMLLIHDIVEADAGDTYAFDKNANLDKKEREERAAERLFGILPLGQGAEWKECWREFDAEKTPEAVFAALLDKIHPVLQNWSSGGKSWKLHQLDSAQIRGRLRGLDTAIPELNETVEKILKEAVARGYIAE